VEEVRPEGNPICRIWKPHRHTNAGPEISIYDGRGRGIEVKEHVGTPIHEERRSHALEGPTICVVTPFKTEHRKVF
jgi:hypothetical protein